MVGRHEAGRRVPAAVAATLLAMGTVVPLTGPITATASPVTVADTSPACAVTIGTATTDPHLSTDAARALAAGYGTTDCMPNAELLAAAEARAALPLGDTVIASANVAGEGTSTGTSAGVLSGSAQVGTANLASLPTTVPPTTTTAPTTTTPATESSTGTTSTGTTSTGTTSTETTTDTSTTLPSDNSGDDGDSGDSGDDGNTTVLPGNDPTVLPGNDPTVLPGNDGTTAAGALQWGPAQRAEDFATDLSGWSLYNGPGHAGNGRRSPSAISVANGVLTIAGDANGTTGGMSWGGGTKYGRYEARVRAPVADPTYNAVMLLWPDAENFPVGGEIDFMEMMDETRQKTDFFLHYGEDNRQLHGETQVNATEWHNWAVEWAPDHITAYVDGQKWFTTTDTATFPPGSMHLTLQLDWFPKDGDGSVQPSAMYVDWVRYYPINGTGPSGTIVNSDDSGLGTVGQGTGTTVTGTEDQDAGQGTDDANARRSGAGNSGGGDDSGTGDDNDVAGTTTSATTTIGAAGGTTTPQSITVTAPSTPTGQASGQATGAAAVTTTTGTATSGTSTTN